MARFSLEIRPDECKYGQSTSETSFLPLEMIDRVIHSADAAWIVTFHRCNFFALITERSRSSIGQLDLRYLCSLNSRNDPRSPRSKSVSCGTFIFRNEKYENWIFHQMKLPRRANYMRRSLANTRERVPCFHIAFPLLHLHAKYQFNFRNYFLISVTTVPAWSIIIFR